ncbi:hypothetical protein Acsp04_21830 [Actinomadura sp. NBRC 104425]|uniref:gas vesicle protein GvpG n=1 Tax=Actinomadura sp. NBRC 104425 TaxID=3032204 RepID=UPI0024A44616|nr:gas vesicle protein GvpG [Actinomadura sp. NBRC 104425]GLZ11948.1 hypothetical protein Acsp04_21830 [Actinomadura sp. NBRC 104425]
MGLITGLATLPLAPVRGVIWVAEVLTEHAEAQLYDPARIAAEMQEIADLLAAGEIDEAEAAAREEELLARLPRSGPAAGSTAGAPGGPAADPAAAGGPTAPGDLDASTRPEHRERHGERGGGAAGVPREEPPGG